MHKNYWRVSSLLMAGAITISSANAGALNVNAATEEAVGDAVVLTEDEASDVAAPEVADEAASKEESAEAVEEKTAVGETAVEKTAVAEEAAEETPSEPAPETTPETETPEVSEEEDEVDENAPEFRGRWNQSDVAKGKLTFAKIYDEYVYDLGEAVPVDQINSISVKVKNQGGNLCIKFYESLEQDGEKFHEYNCNGKDEYKFTPDYEGSVRYVAVMANDNDESLYPLGVTVTDVVVDKEQAENKNEKTLVFEGENLKFSERHGGAEVEGQTLKYEKEWEEYWMSFGETFPIDDIKSIKITTSEATKTLCFKLYDEANTEVTQIYGQSGSSEYVYRPSSTGEACRLAIMAMNGQDEAFPFEVTVKKIEVTVDVTPESERPKKEVEQDIVDLRDPVAAIMGEDFIIGTAASYDEFRDPLDMELATKHFNGVTLGNELKPETMLKESAEIKKQELNGEEVDFPELDFSMPDSRLDYFVDWNNAHPEKQIKIRGHVLVWHSQTPDFFFHEDYDTSKPYATPEVMNKRLEIYVREVAKHYTAEGSKYAGMFYGWDVVNEAISDSTGTYRTDKDGPSSTWWKIYQSPEFINNAFVYANKYMPAEIALFYNDYNDTVTSKVKGICQLIENVKATPGARIDGMGMQGHYQVAANDPSMEQFKAAARQYAALVDQVQITELDFKGSASATDERLAQRYKAVYDTIRRLRNEGVNFTGMTIWGITDKHSWLQTSNSVGGSADGRTKQYPLLFDDYYHAKNAFYAIAEAGDLEPEIKTVTIVQNVNDDYTVGNAYVLGEGESKATFVPVWNEDGISLKVSVDDATVNDADSFTIYTDDGTGIKATTVARADAIATETGYEKIVKIVLDSEALTTNKVKLDVTLTDNDKTFAFGDTTLKQAESSKYFAETVIKPLLAVNKGTATVDGTAEEAWNDAAEVTLSINGGAKATAKAKILWDEEKLYVLANVKDEILNKDSSDDYQQDSLEVFIDENNAKTSSYQDDDKQYRINYENKQSFNGTKCTAENVESAAVVTDDGYVIEAAFKWTDIEAKSSTQVGFDLQINDADDSGKRLGTINWADNTGNGWTSTEGLGTIVLVDQNETPAETPTETPTDTPAETPTDTPSQNPSETVETAKTVAAPTGLTLKYNGQEQVGVAEAEGFTLTGNKATDAGTYTAVAKLNSGYTWTDGSAADKNIEWKIEKADNTLSVKTKKISVSASKLVKKSAKFDAKKAVKVTDAKGDVTYKKVSGNKKIKISKTGKITLKKGLKKGTYKVKVEVTAAGDKNFAAATKPLTIKIKVKK
ncbi:endo-1,4-beta-xylanase [Butyrivibrio sp. VCD2006]|uniref:endo-1,4-beta-xylanase n=1 Tax=Butyrivibrio sp. VCD2006 TaxID=1280664 RepID=UPI00041D5D38|nr:endo-1,4-beta-xylanase [Butyrivibrio sp. VCD2006]